MEKLSRSSSKPRKPRKFGPANLSPFTVFESQGKAHSKFVTMMYFYSLWYKKSCRFELVNTLPLTESKITTLVH